MSSPLIYLNGKGVDALVPDGELGGEIEEATESGHWFDSSGLNMLTGEQEAARYYIEVRDGLAFMSPRFANIPAPRPEPESEPDDDALTTAYVMRAIERYEREGREATVAYYNSRESVEGQRFMSIIDADTNVLLTSPLRPAAVGITVPATATEEGIWIESQGSNPVTNQREPRRTFFILRDGLIFASGYYTGEADSAPPPWQDADPREYTVDYVNRAVERYERDGLEAMKAYYNSVAAFEGQWYLFATDANDIYHVHPLLPRLIGTDIKDVVGADGYELGKEIAKATEEGHWIEYIWPHPSTLKNAPKVSYAVRRDGMIFASGYYPEPEDPAAYTKAYVQKAIDYYEENGLDATVAHYNSENSFEGQWYLGLADSDSRILVSAVVPHVIGSQLNPETVEAIDAGQWVELEWFGNLTAGTTFRHIWGTRHDGLYFYSGYFVEQGTPLPDADME